MMKLRAAVILSWCLASASAFSVSPSLLARPPPTTSRPAARPSWMTTRTLLREQASASAVEVEDVDAAIMDSDGAADVYDQLGIQKEQLALGVKPEEVLKYIGSREDLIQKTLTDIPKLDRGEAEMEVDKFLLDAEMINLYIRFGKEVEKNPDFAVPQQAEQEEGFSPITAGLSVYIAYVFFDTVSSIFRNYVADKEIQGTWEGTNIEFVDKWIQSTSAEATAKALERAGAAVGDAVQQTADSLQSVAADAVVQAGVQ